MMIEIHVPYRPTPQKRHRHTHAGRTYDPCSAEKRDFLLLCLLAHAPPIELPAGPKRSVQRIGPAGSSSGGAWASRHSSRKSRFSALQGS